MAVLVNEVVAYALRLGLHDETATSVVKANGAQLMRRRDKVRNG